MIYSLTMDNLKVLIQAVDPVTLLLIAATIALSPYGFKMLKFLAKQTKSKFDDKLVEVLESAQLDKAAREKLEDRRNKDKDQ